MAGECTRYAHACNVEYIVVYLESHSMIVSKVDFTRHLYASVCSRTF